jgi:hypothetical protein
MRVHLDGPFWMAHLALLIVLEPDERLHVPITMFNKSETTFRFSSAPV